jgi:hypothetical protein
VLLLAALVPGARFSWRLGADGGEAERVFSLGMGSEPLVRVTLHGVGPFEDVTWSGWDVALNPTLWNLALVASGLICLFAARFGGDRERGSDGEAGGT